MHHPVPVRFCSLKCKIQCYRNFSARRYYHPTEYLLVYKNFGAMLYRILTKVFLFWRAPAGEPPRPRSNRPAERAVIVPQRDFVPALQGAVFRGKCYVIDGDTVRMGQTRIRLAGVDAPELDQPWGETAKWALLAMCRGKIVTARATGEISWNRIIATCYLPDGTDVGAEMVRLGHALDFTPFSGGKYKRLEPSGIRRKFRGLHVGQMRMSGR